MIIELKKYITDRDILLRICKERVKIARKRNKRQFIEMISKDCSFLNIAENQETQKIFSKCLPSRRRWSKLGQNNRYHNENLINSIEKNRNALLYTIKKAKKTNPDEQFLKNLNKFIQSIKNAIFRSDYIIKKPRIYPMLKEPLDKKKCSGPIIYRPISNYRLKDKIIISLLNKYLTEIFDKYFYDYSFAFRAKRKDGDVLISLTHHDAIKKIKNYLSLNAGKELFVSECDIKKFYDSVNHTIIKKEFNKIIRRVNHENPALNLKRAKSVFYKYLDSYTFSKDVYPEEKQHKWIQEHDKDDGEFQWIKEDLISCGFYKTLRNTKIGVPQGGALSGLIANIVLNFVDQKIIKIADSELLYIRYCDDMIIIHPNKEKCELVFEEYKKSLLKVKLIPHKPIKITNQKDYNSSKSKSPFLWEDYSKGGIPWISFVGYEIHFNGDVRVRERSLKKEEKKQRDLINRVSKSIAGDNKKVGNKIIEDLVTNKLISMSVGKVRMWNFIHLKNEMCWINGFKEINDNKYTRRQFKRLDSHRNRVFWKFKKELLKTKNVVNSLKVKRNKSKNRQIIYYGKPFSYYYQGLEKRNTKSITLKSEI